MDYGSFLYSTAAPSYKKLNRIQYAACWVILGALRCTSVDCLEAEAGILPLKYRRTELLIKYTIRTLCVILHPFAEAYSRYYPFEFYKESVSPLPVVGRIFELLPPDGFCHIIFFINSKGSSSLNAMETTTLFKWTLHEHLCGKIVFFKQFKYSTYHWKSTNAFFIEWFILLFLFSVFWIFVLVVAFEITVHFRRLQLPPQIPRQWCHY